ncbi:YwdI family protein [Thalassobacillus sp. CUG 92003]|uniref:YwdI family protein n=1 Tax=Thalassobacillus sp. CUG 92003 TaxID=2736641 RepID=UPI0015E68FE5
MAVSNQTVLTKMSHEIQEAMAKQGESTSSVREHVRAVRLMCDLLLDEQAPQELSPSVQEPTEAEIRKMMGAAPRKTQTEDKSLVKTSGSSFDEEDANGNSILDF